MRHLLQWARWTCESIFKTTHSRICLSHGNILGEDIISHPLEKWYYFRLIFQNADRVKGDRWLLESEIYFLSRRRLGWLDFQSMADQWSWSSPHLVCVIKAAIANGFLTQLLRGHPCYVVPKMWKSSPGNLRFQGCFSTLELSSGDHVALLLTYCVLFWGSV